MIKNYQTKSTSISAIKFEYSKEGIELLQEFCNNALISTEKARSPMAIGEAKIKSGCVFNPIKTITEGHYLIKNIEDEFHVLDAAKFNLLYEELK